MTTIEQLTDNTDTIAAISTPHGTGGIAVIRVSGDKAIEITDKIWQGKPLATCTTHTVHLGMIKDKDGNDLDQTVATVYRAPHSYTGQNTVELAVHGSPYIQQETLQSLVQAGARLAMPGEYTRRAFTAGRLDLTQAEAVADIISSQSRAAHRMAISQLKGTFARDLDTLRDELLELVSLLELELDFSEEDVEFADRDALRHKTLAIHSHLKTLADSYHTGNAIKNGIPITIAGPTNAGKSSLLNALTRDDRAIVSDIHGTTRDTIEETMDIEGYTFRFIDTAGLRNTADPIEQLGIERSHKAIRKAHIIILLIDATDPQTGIDYANSVKKELAPHQTVITILNKTDIATPTVPESDISMTTHDSSQVDSLRRHLAAIMDTQTHRNTTHAHSETRETITITNQRQAIALQQATEAAASLLEAMDHGLPADLLAQDARAIISTLSEITGQITTTDILSHIFAHFCIGK